MKILFTIAIILNTICLFAQNTANTPGAKIPHGSNKIAGKDTVIEKDTSKENKEPQYFYISANTDVFVNTKGGAAKRFAPAVEIGRTYGIFDIGLSTGRLNSVVLKRSTVMEFRPTINVFSRSGLLKGALLGRRVCI